jgi:hypothetical protein
MTSRNFIASFCFLVTTLACALAPAQAESADDPTIQDESLHLYAVRILKTRLFQHSRMNGIYLGGGGILTAAHVVGRWHLLKELEIGIAGQELPARIVKEGSVDKTDLTVLSIDEERLPVRLRLRQNPLCKEPLRAGQEVVVVFPQGTARSRILSPLAIAPQYRAKFGTVIRDVPLSGSGSGVFDADKRCLLGIISRRIARIDMRKAGPRPQSQVAEYAKYFVPAPTIASFLPKQFRF